jgi:TonB family protein
VSLGVHGVALIVIAVLAGHRVVVLREVEVTAIEVVEPPPPAPAPPPPSAPAGAPARSPMGGTAGTLGRRGRDAPQRSLSKAPVAEDPFADVIVSYEAPTGPESGGETDAAGAGRGTGLLGDGTGNGTGGVFGLGSVPPAPRPSMARPPRAKRDYRTWNFRAQRRFAGATVHVELTIDPQGRVQDVRVLRGVDEQIDKHATGLARRFEFHPALDAAGDPTWGLHRWEFVLQAEPSIGNYLPRR